jgi:hypothetical protein
MQKDFFLNKFFVGILKVNDENGRIRIWISLRKQIHYSEAWIRGSGSGSTPKCHGYATPLPVYGIQVPNRAGSGSAPLTNGSGSGRPKNKRIRLRIRIPNSGWKFQENPSGHVMLEVGRGGAV